MDVPRELLAAALALRRELEPHFAADTCADGPDPWNPTHPVAGHNAAVSIVAFVELPRRTGLPAGYIVADLPGGPYHMLRVHGPEGAYDVDLTADLRGGSPVRISPADHVRHREVSAFVSADAYNGAVLLATRARIRFDG
jgi:hypothetical protein